MTSGPWLLTTLVLVVMHVTAIHAGEPAVEHAELIITVVYATAVVLGAPLDIVLSRFASDRVYERRRDRIAAPLRRALAASLLLFTAIGAGAMALLGPPLELAIPGALLATVVGGQWLLLSAAGGLGSPGIILRSFAVGAVISAGASLALSRPYMLDAPGYLIGFGLGQLIALSMLLVGTLRALPHEEDEDAAVLPAYREYWMLAAAAFAFHAGLWVDKLIVRLLGGAQIASTYAAAAAVAWLSVIPACAYVFVKVETLFHRRFRAFYGALHAGAALGELDRLARDLRGEVVRTLRGAIAVQACVTLICLGLAPHIASALELGDTGTRMLQWLLVGVAPQMLALTAALLLYYFDFRGAALASALTQLSANIAATLWIGTGADLGAGYVIACTAACVVATGLLLARVSRLLLHTFQSQPYDS